MPSRSAVQRFHTEAPSMRVLRWIIVPLVAVHVVLATFSGYRAIWQIYRLELRVADPVLRPGTSVGFAVVSSGRVEADASLELIQGPVAETLAVRLLPRNGNASYDPRPQRASASVVLTATHLAAFKPGAALVRATANGGMQWLRTPPPTVREQRVEIPPP
jgi:hypothetical protein